MDLSGGPNILEHVQKPVNITTYDTKWIPTSARFVVLGSYARATGCLQIYSLDMENNGVKLDKEVEKKAAFKCGTFGASSLRERHLATGNFEGYLQLWDLERPEKPLVDVKAHTSIVNAIDGAGGQRSGYGPPELVTAGRDGCVRVWDVRQKDAPVAVFEPSEGVKARDCWSVAFGNSFNDEERCVLAGYDNGDVKMFDLRTGTVRAEHNVKNGVCGVEFDRREIAMNKFVVTCLESAFTTFDARHISPAERLQQRDGEGAGERDGVGREASAAEPRGEHGAGRGRDADVVQVSVPGPEGGEGQGRGEDGRGGDDELTQLEEREHAADQQLGLVAG
jgi:WD40 repeat protein